MSFNRFYVASKVTLIGLGAVCFLTSCVGSPFRIAMMDADELPEVSTYALCNAFNFKQDDDIRKELESREEISDPEWDLIDKDQIKVGMSEVALVCSWGKAKRINKSGSSRGVSKQYVYRRCKTCRAQYVYVRNGRVVNWQG